MQELTDLLKAKDEEDDPVMMAVNAKVEEWKVLSQLIRLFLVFCFYLTSILIFKDLHQDLIRNGIRKRFVKIIWKAFAESPLCT